LALPCWFFSYPLRQLWLIRRLSVQPQIPIYQELAKRGIKNALVGRVALIAAKVYSASTESA